MQDRQFGRVWLVYGDRGGKYPFSHSMYLQGDNRKVLIDPASSLEKMEKIKNEGVTEIWLTHWHEDHIRYLNCFEDCPVWISRRDFPPLTDLNIFLDWYAIKDEKRRAFWEKIMLEEFNFRPRHDAFFLGDDQVIDLGGLTAEVIPTPGHTPGHLSFFFPEEELLFLGDYDLTSFGPWYGDVDSSIEGTIKSIRRLKSIRARRWVVSHNNALYEEDPGHLWDAYENVIHGRENRLLTFLESPRTMKEILAEWIIYGKAREPKELYEVNEELMIRKHLEHSLSKGQIVEEDGRYRLV